MYGWLKLVLLEYRQLLLRLHDKSVLNLQQNQKVKYSFCIMLVLYTTLLYNLLTLCLGLLYLCF